MAGPRPEGTCWHSGCRCCHPGKQSEQILIKREDPAHGLRHLPEEGPREEWLGWAGSCRREVQGTYLPIRLSLPTCATAAAAPLSYHLFPHIVSLFTLPSPYFLPYPYTFSPSAPTTLKTT